jgi:hypothetical protein
MEVLDVIHKLDIIEGVGMHPRNWRVPQGEKTRQP